MVKIRLARIGRKEEPHYRIVVSDSRSARDGRFIEQIGHYDPKTSLKEAVVDEQKAIEWLLNGAQPSDTIRHMLSDLGIYAKYLEAKQAQKKTK